MKNAFFIFIAAIILISEAPAQFNDKLHIDYFGQTPPGDTAVVFAPDFISRQDWYVQACCFSHDGKEFVFMLQNQSWDHPIIMYTKYTNGTWSKPDTLFDYAAIPSFSYDGSHLFFSEKNGWQTRDIVVSERGQNGWQKPKRIPFPVSSDSSNEVEVTVSANGSLYFSSDRSGGFRRFGSL